MGNRFQIVLIDDNFTTRLKMCNMLTRHAGWEVVDFADTNEALSFICLKRPGVIISDVHLSGTNGYEFCREVRRLYSLQELPIILLTPLNSVKEVTEVYRAGANYSIVKGSSDAELFERVERIVNYRSIHSGTPRVQPYTVRTSA